MARKDPFALRRLFAPLGDTIDWEQISIRETQEDEIAYEWGVTCLAMAANTICRGALEPLQRLTKLAAKRNEEWTNMAETHTPPNIDVFALRANFEMGVEEF